MDTKSHPQPTRYLQFLAAGRGKDSFLQQICQPHPGAGDTLRSHQTQQTSWFNLGSSFPPEKCVLFFFSYSPCTSRLLPSAPLPVPSWLPTTIVKCRHAMVVCFCFGRNHIKFREHSRHVNLLEHVKTCSACCSFPGLVPKFCSCVQPLGLRIMRMPSSLSAITSIIHICIPYTLSVQITLWGNSSFLACVSLETTLEILSLRGANCTLCSQLNYDGLLV